MLGDVYHTLDVLEELKDSEPDYNHEQPYQLTPEGQVSEYFKVEEDLIPALRTVVFALYYSLRGEGLQDKANKVLEKRGWVNERV